MIACDRYIATNHPIRYRHHRHSIRIALYYVAVSWGVSLAISLLPTLFFEKKIPTFDNRTNRTVYRPPTKYSAQEKSCELYKDLKFVVTSSILSFYFPLMIMMFLYAKVLYAIRQQSMKMNKRSSSQRQRKRSASRKKSKQKLSATIHEQGNDKKLSTVSICTRSQSDQLRYLLMIDFCKRKGNNLLMKIIA